MSAADGSDVYMNGSRTFANNSVAHNGGAVAVVSSNISIDGSTSFTSNSAVLEGGAVYSSWAHIQLSGELRFCYNSAETDGGAMADYQSEIRVEGNSLFANNSALVRGGALFFYDSTKFSINGSTLFSHNSAGDIGGAMVLISADTELTGQVSFSRNSAKTAGGAVFLADSDTRFAGEIWFGYNSAVLHGGALHAHTSPGSFEGSTTFVHNTAGSSGGAMFIKISSISVNGTTSFVDNTAYEGGAIDAHQSPLHLEGSARFVNNSANQDGGAIQALGSNVTIVGEVELSSNAALNGGAISSSLSPIVRVLGRMSFFGNYASFFGGAMSLTDPGEIYITSTTFESNRGTSGGAVYLTPTVGTTGGLENCRFDRNKASDGGALYLSTNDTAEPEKAWFIQDSVFSHNAAVGLGGALFNAGPWAINNTVFSENTAGGDGPAIQDEGSSLLLWNDTFRGNMFTCPSDQYSDANYGTGGTCRLDVVCLQCSVGCKGDARIAMVEKDTIPVCEDIPDGVSRLSTTTLATFDLLEGYYRVSGESRINRECYQREAYDGGTDPLNYCAIGYTGPYCAVCDDGYAPGVMNLCHECSAETRRWTVGLVTAALVLGEFVAVLSVFHVLTEASGGAGAMCPRPIRTCHKWLAKAIPLSAIKIVVVVLQIITQFTEIAGAVFPDQYEAFLSKLTSINLDIGFILSNSCLVTTNFYDRLLVATIGPLVVLTALFGTLYTARRRNTDAKTAEPLLQNKRASTALFIVFFVYSSVSFTVFQTFVCDDLDGGTSYLRADYSIVCSSDKHEASKTYAGIMVCVYPVGIPALFGWWLACNRRDLEKPVREEMAHLESFRGLRAAYSPLCYYYEVVKCFRRIALTGVAVFVLPDSAEQIAVIFLLAVLFTFISESLSHFEAKADMWLYHWGNVIILASMYVALLLKVELTDEGSQASTVMTALLISGNVLMIVMVADQAAFMVKGLYSSTRAGEVHLVPSTSV